MSFSFSFTEGFFTGEYGQSRPCSILEAAERLTLEERRRLAEELGRDLEIWPTCECFAWDLVELAREIDSCDEFSSPVWVYLDPEGREGSTSTTLGPRRNRP